MDYTNTEIRLALYSLMGIRGYIYSLEIMNTRGLCHDSYTVVMNSIRNIKANQNLPHIKMLQYYYWTDEPINR
jgi:hypothetical protein